MIGRFVLRMLYVCALLVEITMMVVRAIADSVRSIVSRNLRVPATIGAPVQGFRHSYMVCARSNC